MTTDPRIVEPVWTGPCSWPTFERENGLPLPSTQSGIYLWTVEHRHGFLVYAAGVTRRGVANRLKQHTREYMCGNYTILDIDSMCAGVRKEIWHGWGWTDDKRTEFSARRESILTSARRQLAAFRIFSAEFSDEPRLIERVEAAVMNAVYQLPSPLCDVADRGMRLAPRRENEEPIRLYNRRSAILYGLPDILDV